MLLAIDIGNTNITFGIFRENRLIKRFDIPTARYQAKLLEIKLKNNKPDDIIICSVVPDALKVLRKDAMRLFGKKPLVVGEKPKVPMRNLYRYPRQVGQDRLVNAYAGSLLYGNPLIVIDFGTAITFDVISGQKAYLGGMILPGMRISLESLFERTALLPRICLAKPKEFIGRDTKNSMLSGIIYGFSSLTDELIMRIRKKIGMNSKAIGTGGNIDLILHFCNKINKKDTDLTLKGLNLLYKNIKKHDR